MAAEFHCPHCARPVKSTMSLDGRGPHDAPIGKPLMGICYEDEKPYMLIRTAFGWHTRKLTEAEHLDAISDPAYINTRLALFKLKRGL